ncbi:MAG: type II toxin-antitoxin system VapB family antitoxin [Planctomycetota bacterium]|nr:type II toxin-antitoxin system VapB family antitoxin [Planctomycetota bacterium]
MRTTIRLDENLLLEAKRYAARRRKTLTAVIEESLRETLARQHSGIKAQPVKLPIFKGRGLQPGIDLDDSAALLEAMDDPRASS